MLGGLQEWAQKAVLRIAVVEAVTLLIVHILVSYCFYGAAVATVVISGFILASPLICSPSLLAVGIVSHFAKELNEEAQGFFRKNFGEAAGQLRTLLLMAMCLHMTIMLRITIAPLFSGAMEHFFGVGLSAFGFGQIVALANNGFRETIEKFIRVTGILYLIWVPLYFFAEWIPGPDNLVWLFLYQKCY